MSKSIYSATLILLSTLSLFFIACTQTEQAQSQNNQIALLDANMKGNYTYEVVKTLPHDTSAFTQGLVFYQGSFYESTGLQGQSSLRLVEVDTGKVAKKVSVPAEYFAEGMTIFQGKIFQLTWLNQKGFVYDLGSLQKEKDFSYYGEGWGLTNDEKNLILSDGTNKIRFIDPFSFEVLKTISVSENGQPIANLNELEYIKGQIFANVWQTNRIIVIDPSSGNVTASIDLTGILKPEDVTTQVDVLNGIAYDLSKDRLFVTGKLWPKIFEIKLKKK
ncbi:MAG: glutaminyl-peptide cyclotransferase [Acidobacteria bacterium]|nr:glutaminyl-peptide cyclotransferase [Acidobacteriota bacterium]